MTTLPLLVEAPAVAPYQYGLASVAIPADRTDEHWRMGVQYEPIAGFVPGVAEGMCAGPWSMSLPGGAGVVKGVPFTIYAGVDCAAVGYDEDYIIRRAQAILDLGWQNAAEKVLWSSGGLSDAAPKLNASTATTIGTGLSLTAAVGALEKYMRANYMATANIHATPDVSAYAGHAQLVRERVGSLQTVAGSKWVFGGGYDGTGPSNAAPASGHTWLYATGIITVRRGTPTISGGLAAALNRSTNDAPLYAQQSVVLTVDGPTVAVGVDLTA